MRSCKEISILISESLDRQLPLHQRIAIRIHLLMCTFCSRYRQQVLFLRDLMNHLVMGLEDEAPYPSAPLSQDVRDRIKHALKTSKP